MELQHECRSGTYCILPLIEGSPAAHPKFGAAAPVTYTTDNGGQYLARVRRSRYSPYWQCYVYDLTVTGDTVGSMVYAVHESALTGR